MIAALFLAAAAPIRAMEGTAKLGSVGGELGSCFAASVYQDGRYRVLMTCRGLRSALDPVRNRYVVWIKNGENFKRLGEIVNGKLQGSIDNEFEGLIVTAEEDSYVNKPNGEVLLSGRMVKIDFGETAAEKEELVVVEDNKVVDEVSIIDDRGAVTPMPLGRQAEVEENSSVGSVFKVLGKALLTGFVVLLGVVGVLSYLSRRKK